MGTDILGMLDFADRDEPEPDTDWRRMLTEWLEYQRHQFRRKLRDLSAEGLVEWSVPPVELSVSALTRSAHRERAGRWRRGRGLSARSDAPDEEDVVVIPLQRHPPTLRTTRLQLRAAQGVEELRDVDRGACATVTTAPPL